MGNFACWADRRKTEIGLGYGLRTHTVHTYIHAYIHTYMHTYMHTYIHRSSTFQVYIHTYLHTYIHIDIYLQYFSQSSLFHLFYIISYILLRHILVYIHTYIYSLHPFFILPLSVPGLAQRLGQVHLLRLRKKKAGNSTSASENSETGLGYRMFYSLPCLACSCMYACMYVCMLSS